LLGEQLNRVSPLIRREVGRVVGVAVANVVTLLDLEVVLVAGSVALGFGDDFFDSAQELLRKMGKSALGR
jgi:predicted NBD/HSP70 family sugar kinase